MYQGLWDSVAFLWPGQCHPGVKAFPIEPVQVYTQNLGTGLTGKHDWEEQSR